MDSDTSELKKAYSYLPNTLFYSGVGFFAIFLMAILTMKLIGPEIDDLEMTFIAYGMVGTALIFIAGGMYAGPMVIALWRYFRTNPGDLHVE